MRACNDALRRMGGSVRTPYTRSDASRGPEAHSCLAAMRCTRTAACPHPICTVMQACCGA
eukprot:811722-Pelagomonas_calceolata.AAC.2